MIQDLVRLPKALSCWRTYIPVLTAHPDLQNTDDGVTRLKRVILIGDHHQLPPVVKNMAFQKYSHLDQSLFTRFVRLGTPYVQLNAQVTSRLLLQPECRAL